MGRDGPIYWPTRSPDLNMLDYFICYIKTLIEHRRDEDEKRKAILAAFNVITPEMAHRATRNIVQRSDLYLQEQGWHFKQFLH